MQTDKFKFLSAAARKITVLSEFKSNGSVAVNRLQNLQIMPIRSEFKNRYLYLVFCKTLPSTHNISYQVKITVK